MPKFRKNKKKIPAGKPASPAGVPAPMRPGAPATPASKPYDWRSYDVVAGEYARTHDPITAEVARVLLESGDVGAGAKLLDIGTGTGKALEHAHAAVGPEGIAVGVDNALGMLRLSKTGRVAQAEAINLPFRDELFDVAMLNLSLPYFTKLPTVLFDVRRVLRPGGKLLVATWGADEDDLSKTWRLLVEESIGRDILQAGLKDETPWAELLSDPRRFETALRDAGFRPVTVERRRLRFEVSREDYIVGHEIEASGRYTRAMLGERLWPSFTQRVRATFAERFPERLVDFRDVLLARAGRP